MTEETIELGRIFDYVEIETTYLNNLLQLVMRTIGKSIDLYEDGFGPLIEGETFAGREGEVTGDGYIILDSKKLQQHDDDIAMAIIAHELAHYHLKHYVKPCGGEEGLKREGDADELAKKWGFNIDKFRKTCGPPYLKLF